MNKNKFVLGVFGAALLGGAIALGGYKMIENHEIGSYLRNDNPPQYRLTGSTSVPGNLDFTYAAEVSTPTVVHITTYQKVVQRNYGGYYDPFQDDFFRQFFGDDFVNPRQPQRSAPKENKETETEQKAGSGSGVILSADGYIVTNNHVVKGADKIEVVLNDKRRYKAELIGIDPTTDLAVLKIEEKDLAYIKYGNSDKLKVGEWVLAVGNPFDLTSTVTAGIISAKARNINILKDKENMAIESFIQTDAAVNPGNSGGALVNLQGELIGINTAIATPTGTFAGYSFAVPSTLVQKVVEDLIKFGQVQRALLGVNIAEVTDELKQEKKLDKIEGVYIVGVREGGSGSEAGLKEGDVVLKINENFVNSPSELQEQVAMYRPGDKINITFKRDGKIQTSSVTLKNKMGNTSVVKKEDKSVVMLYNSQVRAITDEEAEDLGIEAGIKILTIGEGKFKANGIKSGFVITKVDKKEVSDPNELIDYLNDHEGALLIEGLYSKNQRAYYAIGY